MKELFGTIVVIFVICLVITAFMFLGGLLFGDEAYGILIAVALYIIWVKINLNKPEKKTPENKSNS